MDTLFWQEFGVLFVLSLIGAAAVVPYALKMAGNKPMPFSRPVVLLLSLVQNAVIFALVIWLGLLASHKLGFGAPYLEAMLTGSQQPSWSGVIGVVMGIVVGAVLLIGDLFFLPHWPPALKENAFKTTPLENLAASFYGGINEELLMRLFALSALAWLWSLIAPVSQVVLWLINAITTVLFGLGHLPALKNIVGTLSRIMIERSLILNAPVGLVCGWLFWTHGLESAILAHFSADIVYHVMGTYILRRAVRGTMNA